MFPVIALILIAIFLPKLFQAVQYFIITPMLGVAFGGFVWSIVSIFYHELITFQSFGLFAIVGVVIVTCYFISID